MATIPGPATYASATTLPSPSLLSNAHQPLSSSLGEGKAKTMMNATEAMTYLIGTIGLYTVYRCLDAIGQRKLNERAARGELCRLAKPNCRCLISGVCKHG